MKKGFGWFFIVLGILNIIRGSIMFTNSADNNAGFLIIWAIGFIVLGGWMLSSSGKENGKNKKD